MKLSRQEIPLTEGSVRYIKISEFKDKSEYDMIFHKVELLLKEWNAPRRVF